MKRKFRFLATAAMAVTLCAVMAAPVQASTEVTYLFAEYFHEEEALRKEVETDNEGIRRGHRSDDDDDDQWYVYVDLDYVTRPQSVSTSIGDDVKIIEDVKVVVPKGKTLTVDKGATMVVHGMLVVEGKLNNKGTIIIGDKSAYKYGAHDLGRCEIANEGEIYNSGSIEIARGNLRNEANGMLENSGEIRITNKHSELMGLVNATITRYTTTRGGTIRNTESGVIYVQNTMGYGIRIATESTFENNGKVYRDETGRIMGKIIGNKPIRITEDADEPVG